MSIIALTGEVPAAGLTPARRVPSLDGLRGVAILAVMAFHFVFEIFPGGAFGVDLFFVLSSYLITGLLIRERTKYGNIDYPAFYVRRVTRLFPALILFLVLVAPPIAVVLGNADGILISTLTTFFYTADFAAAGYWRLVEPYGHTWSLAVEEQFYLVWPVTLMLILRRQHHLIRLGAGLFVGGAIVTAILTRVLGVGPNYFLPTGHLPALAAGCMTAFVAARSGPPPRWLTSQLVSVAALVGFLFLTVAPRQGWPEILQELSPLPVLALSVGLTLHASAGANTMVNRALSIPVLVWFGTRSYGLYLYHTAFYYLFTREHVPVSRTINAVLAFGLSLVVSELSFRFVESPITRRGAQWSRQRRASAAAQR